MKEKRRKNWKEIHKYKAETGKHIANKWKKKTKIKKRVFLHEHKEYAEKIIMKTCLFFVWDFSHDGLTLANQEHLERVTMGQNYVLCRSVVVMIADRNVTFVRSTMPNHRTANLAVVQCVFLLLVFEAVSCH